MTGSGQFVTSIFIYIALNTLNNEQCKKGNAYEERERSLSEIEKERKMTEN